MVTDRNVFSPNVFVATKPFSATDVSFSGH